MFKCAAVREYLFEFLLQKLVDCEQSGEKTPHNLHLNQNMHPISNVIVLYEQQYSFIVI